MSPPSTHGYSAVVVGVRAGPRDDQHSGLRPDGLERLSRHDRHPGQIRLDRRTANAVKPRRQDPPPGCLCAACSHHLRLQHQSLLCRRHTRCHRGMWPAYPMAYCKECLEVHFLPLRPLKSSYRRSAEHCKLPHWVLGQNPSQNRIGTF